jgi:hypothetical protein
MKPRPAIPTEIHGVALRPVGGDALRFHLDLTDAEGRKMPFVLSPTAAGQLLDQHVSAITLLAMPQGGLLT